MNNECVDRFAISRRTVQELPEARPLELLCVIGTLWLTMDNDPRDLVLESGQRALLEAKVRILAYALDDAVVEVSKCQA